MNKSKKQISQNLIDAAPALLAALKDILMQLQNYEPKTYFHAAEDAIKKAEGKE